MRLLEMPSLVEKEALRVLHRVTLPPAPPRYQPNTNGPDNHSHHPTPPPAFVYRRGVFGPLHGSTVTPTIAALNPPFKRRMSYNHHRQPNQARHHQQPNQAYHRDAKGHPVIDAPSFEEVKKAEESPLGGRAFTYTMVGASGVLGAMAAKSTVIDFLSSLSAAGTVLALAQVEVDLSSIPQGKNVVVKWRGKPIFIRHRTDAEIEEADAVPLSELRDPQRDVDRVQRPQWLVMLGICTHLGCVPLGESGDYGGCGSHYDISGRVRKGPAPTNLEIPKYSFMDDHKIVIG